MNNQNTILNFLKPFIITSFLSLFILFTKEGAIVGSKSHEVLGRIGPFAIVDIVFTIIAAWIFNANVFLMFLTGIIMHELFKIRTPLNQLLFKNFRIN